MSASLVRSAVLRDAEAMAAIASQNPTAPQWTAAQFCGMLQPRPAGTTLCRSLLVVEHADEVAGFAVASALCAVFPVEAELESLAVAPALQGCGYGLSLLQQTLAWAAAQKAESLRLEVRASNQRALRIYNRAGFRQTGRRPGYYTAPVEDAVVMERTLASRSADPATERLA